MKLECVLFWYVCLFNQNTEDTGVVSFKAATRNLTEKLTSEQRQSRFTIRGIEVSGRIKETITSKAAANEIAQSLVSLGYTTLEREDIAMALDEKALAQTGLTSGTDRIAESTQNADILISGTLAGESPQKMRLILKAVSLKNMQILAASEGHVSQNTADWQDKIHEGWHFAFHGGIGYNFVTASPIDTLQNVSLRGFGPFFLMQTGYALRKNWILGMGIGYIGVTNPYASDPKNLLTDSNLKDKQVSELLSLLTVTWYSEDNYFVVAGVGAASAVYRNKDSEITIDAGYSLHLGVGREFYVAKYLALGGSVYVNYSQINLRNLEVVFPTTQGNIRDDNFTIRNWNIGIAISLSYS